MSRIVLAVTLVVFAALPAQAQKQHRTFVNARGLVCKEKSDDRDGKEKYDLKCRAPKGNKKHADKNECVDRNRNGRCDVDVGGDRRYPSRFPDMMASVFYDQGRRPNDVTDWLGNEHYRVRRFDADRTGRPRRATWLDDAGRVAQEWSDTNADGRADIVRVFRDGRLMRVFGR